MSEKFEFRSVFNENSVKQTAKQIKEVYPDFQEEAFVTDVLNGFGVLSFGDRNTKITDNLYTYLPKAFPSAIVILVDALGEALEVEESSVSGVLSEYQIYNLSHFGANFKEHFKRTPLEALNSPESNNPLGWDERVFEEYMR